MTAIVLAAQVKTLRMNNLMAMMKSLNLIVDNEVNECSSLD